MKKSLSVLVATAMVSSMFASVAFAAELTTQEKLDALIAAGIFDKDGTGQGSELEANMSREQLAKIVALLKKLEVQSGTSYTDVAADRWSAGFIQAVSKVKPMIMDGVADGVFDPSGDVTLEQLATVAVRALGLTVKTDAEVKGEVSDWAKGYVATAVANGLLPDAANTDFTKPAIRAELVEATYAAKKVLDDQVKPEKVSVKEAKAVGVQTVEVKLDRDVDTAKAKLELKKGSTVIATDVKWSDDKKSATLTLKDLKVNVGTYTVTLSGLEADDIEKASASFEAQNEEVTKLEFKNPSDTVASADTVKIAIVATNQYGEKAAANAGSYTAYATTPGGARVTKADNGDLYVIVDTLDSTLTPNMSSFSINVYNNDSRVSISKTFKIGLAPMVSKVELGEIKYANGKEALTNAGDQAVIKLVQIDQYGQEITQQTGNLFPINLQITPNFNNQFKAEVQDKDNDNIDEVVVTLNTKATVSSEQTVTVFGGGSTSTAKVAVKAVAVPAKVEFGDISSTTYADGDQNKYVTLNMYDAEGNLLSAQDVVDNVDRVTISASGNIVFGATTDVPEAMFAKRTDGTFSPIIAVGANKGKIHIANLNGKGTANMFAYTSILESGATSSTNTNLPISDARYPVTMTVATESATKGIEGGETELKLLVKDQYGENLENLARGYVRESNGTTVTYDVYVSTSADSNANISYGLANGEATIAAVNNNGYKFVANSGSTGGSKQVTFSLRKLNATVATDGTVTKGTAIDDKVKSITKDFTVIDPTAAGVRLTYSAGAVADLFNAIENKVHDGSVHGAVYDSPTESKHAKKIAITAKDSSGATVAIPKTVLNVSTSNEEIAKVGVLGGEAYVIGNKPGKTTVSVSYRTAKGDYEAKSVEVNVKNDAISVASVAAGSATYKVKSFTTSYAYKLMNNVTVKDQYGSEYKSTGTTDVVFDYNALLGIQYLISEVKGTGNPTVTLGADGRTVTTSGNVTSFLIQAVSANGKVATTQVVIDATGTAVQN